MNEHKALWDRVCMTDPRAVKEITGKQYKGNSPKPYWIVERLTEEFGPCGIGWGFSVLSERFERFSDTDSLHVALVDFWYVLGDKTGHVQQVGQTKSSYMSAGSKFILDEDAPKKSVTDALVKCASYIGFAGDIFAGRWDDSKYVATAKAHYQDKPGTAEHKQDMSPKARAARITLGVAEGDATGAALALSGFPDAEYQTVWKLLDETTQDKLIAAWPQPEAA